MLIDFVLYYVGGRGGVEEVTTKVVNGLIKRGHRVRVFLASPPTYTSWVYSVPEMYFYALDYDLNSFGDYGYKYGIRYREMIEKMGAPDIVVATHQPVLSFMCEIALSKGRLKKIPIISWIHSPADMLGNRQLLNYSNTHMAISKDIAKDLSKWINPKDIYFVGNPITIKNIKQIERETSKLSMTFVGRICAQKNLYTLFNALNNLPGNWELNIFGDGEQKNDLMRLATLYNISNKIKWLGWQEHPWDHIEKTSITVISSDFEGFSLTTAESLARGIPVISTACIGPASLIEDGINGWLYPVKDSNSLRNILENILNHTYRLPTAEACIQSIQFYNEDAVIDRINKVITETYYKYN